MISRGAYEQAAEIGRAQAKNGAQVLDICLANPDRDEYTDMQHCLPFMAGKTRVPLMLDSTDARVLELALKHCQGKAIINSINLEDGEEHSRHWYSIIQTRNILTRIKPDGTVMKVAVRKIWGIHSFTAIWKSEMAGNNSRSYVLNLYIICL